MVSVKRPTKLVGGEQFIENIPQSTNLPDVLQDFTIYNQLLQEECHLVFQQLQATGRFLSSLSIYEYETLFNDNSFSVVKQMYDEFVNSLETDEFVMNTIFVDTTNENNVLLGGGLGIDEHLLKITEDTVGTYSTKDLLFIIKSYQNNYQTLSLQAEQKLLLCITEYQVKAMTSLNKLYLGDVSVSCMLFGAFVSMSDVLQRSELEGGASLSDLLSSTATFARQSVDMTTKKVRDLAIKTQQVATTIAKAAHKDIENMPLNKKLNIIQNLFADMLRWAGKQLMIRLRAPEFDVSAVSDMSSFKDEMMKFISNRINQLMMKSENFRQNERLRKERLVWILSVLENIESLLGLIQTISQLSMQSMSADLSFKAKVSTSMSSGIKVDLEPNEWLKEITGSVAELKSIVESKKDVLDTILQANLYKIIREGEQTRKDKELDRQIYLLDININRSNQILSNQPNNNQVRIELGRFVTLRDKLIETKNKNSIDIEQTCIQLLQEIYSYVSAMNVPSIPLDIITKQIITKIALNVDYSAFTSTANTVVSEISKIDIGLKSYFSCIGKYVEFVPNITNVFEHIGFSISDISNVIDKLGAISGFISNVASSAGMYIQAANICLLVIHLIVAASLNSRNKTLNKEKVTLEDIKKASKERMERSKPTVKGGKVMKRSSRGGGTLPPIMQAQGKMFKMREGLVDKSLTLPFIVQGKKAVFNERVKNLSMYLLEPQFTQSEILQNIKFQDIPKSLSNSIISNVGTYMYANEQSLKNSDSVLKCLKEQLPQLRVGQYDNVNNCNSPPTTSTSEEDVYILSMFSKYQGKQLRDSFTFSSSTVQPSTTSLYCSVSRKIHLHEPRLNVIVASIINNFTGMDAISGGGKRKLRKQDKDAIRSYLEKKTMKQLHTYAQLKNIETVSRTTKKDLIDAIVKTKTR